MKDLLQRVSVFLRHIIDAPETMPETREVAEELERDVDDAINGNYREGDDEEE
ncbi:hypothetical protein [Stieleria neptunia]|uniref:Uncharacterized protein n=2 Tax=Stieleria TaxID=2795973 RepID=A0A518HY45_9BACT|nr:hypothetical protein [Stieleria neptunia]QDV40902.1 hypothetical protein Enr13x_07380 [Stieleria neptunia]QDV45783.1 hypothetical protein Enr13x_56630 [Stieleria neptunia]QDV87327.1 hypothetical protein TBK1r_63570 [Planctomycetes bacterium TBK1r]